MSDYPRSNSDSDHDILIRIDENLKNHMKAFADHESDDCGRFDDIEQRMKRFDYFMVLCTCISCVAGVVFNAALRIVEILHR